MFLSCFPNLKWNICIWSFYAVHQKSKGKHLQKKNKKSITEKYFKFTMVQWKPFIVITFGQMQNVYINQMISITSELILRPCIRQNFPNFSFSRVWEMFGCRSSEIFWKKLEFLHSRHFLKKVRKKVWKFQLDF